MAANFARLAARKCFSLLVESPLEQLCFLVEASFCWGPSLTLGNSGGNQFSTLANGNCQVPQNLVGEVFVLVTNQQSVTDGAVIAG